MTTRQRKPQPLEIELNPPRRRLWDRVRSLLVGLRFAGLDESALPTPGAAIEVEGRSVGELTSALHSPRFGAIALGFSVPGSPGGVRRA